jgi:hypothetical protein
MSSCTRPFGWINRFGQPTRAAFIESDPLLLVLNSAHLLDDPRPLRGIAHVGSVQRYPARPVLTTVQRRQPREYKWEDPGKAVQRLMRDQYLIRNVREMPAAE